MVHTSRLAHKEANIVHYRENTKPEVRSTLHPGTKPCEISPVMDSKGPVVCELCGTYFESRRGLSSHARLHLRQLGVNASDTGGAPIELLYQIIQERDGSFPDSRLAPPAAATSTSTASTTKKTAPKDKGSPPTSKVGTKAAKTPPKTATVGSPAAVARKSSPGPSSSPSATGAKSRPGAAASPSPFLLPSSPHRAPEAKVGGAGRTAAPTAKPLWAPQETDAPLTLAMNSSDEVHVCQLCGAWYETRKGLASHARAHLRQLGVMENTETKGGPIELLYQLMDAEDLKPIGGGGGKQDAPSLNSPSKPSGKWPAGSSASPAKQGAAGKAPPSSPLQPARKRPKLSGTDAGLAHDYRFSSGGAAAGPAKLFFTCILCGEEFENRKGLASHSRSHLRQLGVTDQLGKASAIETVQQLVSSGVLPAAQPVGAKANAPSLGLAPAPAQSPVRSTQSPVAPAARGPRAKKGSRLAVPKPEPLELQVSDIGSPGSPGGLSSGTPTSQPISTSESGSSIPMIPCEFCGQVFDSRKALSCHARSHLRQLGIAWSLNESPIDILREVMLEGVDPRGSGSSWGQPTWAPQGAKRSLDGPPPDRPSPKTFTPPLDFSLKERRSPEKSSSSQPVDACCELCGFDFENRKALASHARAHLRQLGVMVKGEGVKGSPVEVLSEWIQREPAKVAEITRRYQVGDLYIKKRMAPSPSLSSDSDLAPAGSQKPLGFQLSRRAGREVAGVAGGASRAGQGRSHTPAGHQRTQAGRNDPNVRSPRGFERHPSKHHSHLDDGEEDSSSQQPPRSGNIPALLPKPPPTPLVKLVGKVYSLKCRFCEEVFQGPLSVQEDWIRHLQKHILDLSYNKTSSPPPTPSQDHPPLVPGLVPSPLPSTSATVLLAPLAV